MLFGNLSCCLVTGCTVISDGDETNGRSGGAGDGDVMDVTDVTDHVTDHYEFVASDDEE